MCHELCKGWKINKLPLPLENEADSNLCYILNAFVLHHSMIISTNMLGRALEFAAL